MNGGRTGTAAAGAATVGVVGFAWTEELDGTVLFWLVKVELLAVVDKLDGVELLTIVLVVLSAGCSSPFELQPARPAASIAATTAPIIALMPHPPLRMDLSLRLKAQPTNAPGNTSSRATRTTPDDNRRSHIRHRDR